MTRSLSAENYAALKQRRLMARDFITFIVRDRETGASVYDHEWSDVGSLSAQVIDPDTGAAVTRLFNGSGSLIAVSDIPLVSGITVQTITITLSQVAERVNDLVRTYDCKQGIVQIFRGLFDPDTRKLVAPAAPRFIGFINHIDIKTPKEGDEGGVTLTCTSHTQEMTRSNPDTRSDGSQRLRSATDDFYADTTVVADWEHFWGKSSGKVAVSVPGSTKEALVQ